MVSWPLRCILGEAWRLFSFLSWLQWWSGVVHLQHCLRARRMSHSSFWGGQMNHALVIPVCLQEAALWQVGPCLRQRSASALAVLSRTHTVIPYQHVEWSSESLWLAAHTYSLFQWGIIYLMNIVRGAGGNRQMCLFKKQQQKSTN